MNKSNNKKLKQHGFDLGDIDWESIGNAAKDYVTSDKRNWDQTLKNGVKIAGAYNSLRGNRGKNRAGSREGSRGGGDRGRNRGGNFDHVPGMQDYNATRALIDNLNGGTFGSYGALQAPPRSGFNEGGSWRLPSPGASHITQEMLRDATGSGVGSGNFGRNNRPGMNIAKGAGALAVGGAAAYGGYKLYDYLRDKYREKQNDATMNTTDSDPDSPSNNPELWMEAIDYYGATPDAQMWEEFLAMQDGDENAMEMPDNNELFNDPDIENNMNNFEYGGNLPQHGKAERLARRAARQEKRAGRKEARQERRGIRQENRANTKQYRQDNRSTRRDVRHDRKQDRWERRAAFKAGDISRAEMRQDRKMDRWDRRDGNLQSNNAWENPNQPMQQQPMPFGQGYQNPNQTMQGYNSQYYNPYVTNEQPMGGNGYMAAPPNYGGSPSPGAGMNPYGGAPGGGGSNPYAPNYGQVGQGGYGLPQHGNGKKPWWMRQSVYNAGQNPDQDRTSTYEGQEQQQQPPAQGGQPPQGGNMDNYWQSYWQNNPYAYAYQGPQIQGYQGGNAQGQGMNQFGAPPPPSGGYNYNQNYFNYGGRLPQNGYGNKKKTLFLT